MTIFREMFAELAAIGGDRSAGYRRLAWTDADREARRWFSERASGLGLDVELDGNGNIWAYRGGRDDVVATGSHLDTVIDGGAFDGALGVVGGLAAVAELDARGHRPSRPLAVVAWVEEEGARFGVPTLGSRLLAGAVDADRARGLTDAAGVTYAEAMADAGLDTGRLGRDPERLGSLRCFVELHVEQGRGLADLGQPVGAIASVWPHGRWRLDATGTADHAGAARLEDRRDPGLVVAAAIRAGRDLAGEHGVRATVGRVRMDPNTTNTVPAAASAWLDARGADESSVRAMVDAWTGAVTDAAAGEGVAAAVTGESWSPGTEFDAGLRAVIRRAMVGRAIEPTELPTAAGHDAATLAAHVPAAMIHVRNPTGTSHAPSEYADLEDCARGVDVLADVLEDLTS